MKQTNRLKRKRFLSLLLTVGMMASAVTMPTAALAEPVTATASAAGNATPERIRDGVILHAFDWNLNVIESNLQAIADAGYTAIQTSPIMGSSSGGENWASSYTPRNMIAGGNGNKFGDRAAFVSLTTAAEKLGIKIIVDVIPNHIGSVANSDAPWNDSTHFHNVTGNVGYNDRFLLTQPEMIPGLRDLDTHSKFVQDSFIAYLKDMIDAGASGFRYDAIKHVELDDDLPSPASIAAGATNTKYPDGNFASDYVKNVTGAAKAYLEEKGKVSFQYGEVLQGGDPNNDRMSGYAKYIDLTASMYGHHVRGVLEVGDIGRVDKWTDYSAEGLRADQLVPWVESHDTYNNEGESKSFSPKQIRQGWAMIAARKDASPLFFARNINADGTQRTNVRTAEFVDYNRPQWSHPEVVAVNKFHNAMAGRDENLKSLGNNAVMIERGTVADGGGAVLINTSTTARVLGSVEVQFLKDGFYVNALNEADVFTVSNGRISGTIPGNPAKAGNTDTASNPGLVVLMEKEEADSAILAALPNDDDVSAGNSFTGNQIRLRMSSVNVSNASYAINNGDAKSFAHNDIITVSANYNDPITVTLVGRADGGNWMTKAFTYTRVEPAGSVPPPVLEPTHVNIYLSINRNASFQAWASSGVWAYSFNPELFGGWPGGAMTRMKYNGADTHWYKIEAPRAAVGGIIFNNNSGQQTGQPAITASMLNNEQLYFYGTGASNFNINGSSDTGNNARANWDTAFAAGNNIGFAASGVFPPGRNGVFFNTSDGSAVANQYVRDGEKAIRPATDPTRSGYLFDGKWYTDSAFTQEYNFDTPVVNTLGDNHIYAMTLYAGWIELEAGKFLVEFNTLGGSPVMSIPNLVSGTSITAPQTPVRNGYTFGGWFKDSAYTQAWNFESDTVTEATTLFAKWELVPYAITYRDGEVAAAMPGSVPTVYTVETETFSLSEPSPKEGFTFAGWYTDSQFLSSSKLSSIAVGSVGDKTLYARFMANTYNITLDPQSGSSGTASVSVNYGGMLPLGIARPVREGYAFQGFYANTDGTGQQYYNSDGVRVFTGNWSNASSSTLYANWSMETGFVPVTEIRLNGQDTITTKGGSLSLTAEVLPADATNKAVIWSVENGTGSATIQNTGLLTAVNDGTVTVKATAADGSGIMDTKTITISGQTTSNPDPTDDTIRILMVGNSLTRYNDVADKLERLFAYAGKEAIVDTRTQMGASLLDQAEILAVSTREAILNGDYDYVVLQEKSSGFTEALLTQGVGAFNPWILEAESKPQLVLYMPWSNEDVFKTMQTTFTNAYVKVAKSYGALLAPSGEAYYDLYFNEGKSWYRNGDNVHGNDLASLISASTLFYTMSGQEQPVLQIRETDQSVVKALVESSDYRNYPVSYDRDLVNLIERKAHAFADSYRDLNHVPDLTGRGMDATVNLAKQKQGSASSNARGATRGIGARNVGNLTDGSTTSFIVLHEEDPDPWFAVDLGAKTAFNQLTLYWGAADEYADSYRTKFTIEGTNDPEAGYETIATGQSTSSNKQEIRFAGVEYRYVRVHVTEKIGEYASLYEMEVYNLPGQGGEDPSADFKVNVGDYLQIQVGDSLTNMSLYEQGMYEAEAAFPRGVKDYKILRNGELIYKGAIKESNAAQNVIIRLFAADSKVVTGQDVHKDVNGNPVQDIKKVANWTGNFFNRNGIEEFKAFGGWDQASPLSALPYRGGGIFAREFTYTVPAVAVSYDYKINYDQTWNNGEIPSANRRVVFPTSDKERDTFVLWVNSLRGELFDSINDGSTTFKTKDNNEYGKAIGTAKVELSLSKEGNETLYPMVQTGKNAYMVTAFITPGTYTWADKIDDKEGTLSGSFTVDKNAAVTFQYRVNSDDYVMLNTVDHAERFMEAIPVETIHISGNDAITTKGGTLQLTAEALPANATNKAVVWSVDNGTGSATISAAGLLTAVSDGTVTVKATAADGSGILRTKSITISGQTTSNPGPTDPPGNSGPSIPSTPAPTDVIKVGNKAIVEFGSDITSKSIPVQDIGGLSLQVKAANAVLIVQANALKQWLTQAGNPSGASIEVIVAPVTAGDIANAPAQGGRARVEVASVVYDITIKLKYNDERIDISHVEGGVEITLPYNNEADEDLLGIYYYNEETKAWEYVGGSVNTAKHTVTVTLEHLSKYAVLEYAKSFSDVSSNHWVARTLEVLAAKHIINGTSETHFTPNGQTTRAEFTSLLVRALGLTQAASSVPFEDVQADQWYAKEVAIAYKAGLVSGVSETQFDPNAKITREQMAVLLVRAYEYKNRAIAATGQETAGLKDGPSISAWAAEEVNKAIAAGLLQGKGNGIFDPASDASRAQTAQAILNLLNKL
ncbi:hypothetical protein PAT3040_04971 [Paenibacillus agaridevorans]|uniref:Alpha-amylase n=1 Tax=Paenibacillus agaridevorans TaxID=171404 RepID=A0A2R5EUA6_9BACL|nr:InlB B-repeat-containing protein [Paenibacillus agaridevorans]GBG10250.1 hypothetical protein PAT3040_04971 [Paenibacillus agaridevorans]